MSRIQFIEALRSMKFTVFAILSDDGRLVDSSDGFVKLLPPKKDSYVSVNVGRFFLQPKIDDLIKQSGDFTGHFTIGTYSGKSLTLSGSFCREDDGWLFLAENDQNELSEISSRFGDLNYQLTESQRLLSKSNSSLKKREEQAIASSLIDQMTGLGNRRQLEKSLNEEISLARRSDRHLSLIMCDLDHFKNVNDEYGHDVGDIVLKSFGKVILRSIRDYDVATRYGGEEFAILLPDDKMDGAVAIAERIRAAIEMENFPPYPVKVTASFGVAKLTSADTPETLLKNADIALYQAKGSGRNRVTEFENTIS